MERAPKTVGSYPLDLRSGIAEQIEPAVIFRSFDERMGETMLEKEVFRL